MKRILTDEDRSNVRSIRSSYYQALSEGHSIQKASQIANKRLAPDDETTRAPRARRPDLAMVAKPQRVGGPSPANLASEPREVDIPDGYSDLPWNQLRALAKSIQDTVVRDKNDAVGIIDAEMRRRASQKEPGEGVRDHNIGARNPAELEDEASAAHAALIEGATTTPGKKRKPDGTNPDPQTGTVAGVTNVEFSNDPLKPKEIGTGAGDDTKDTKGRTAAPPGRRASTKKEAGPPEARLATKRAKVEAGEKAKTAARKKATTPAKGERPGTGERLGD
jgi:hypothetical protein